MPLIKKLRQRGSLTCLAASPFESQEIFTGFRDNLFDQVIRINSLAAWPHLAARVPVPFDTIYLDYFASTRKNLALASMLGKRVVTNHVPEKFPAFLRKNIHHITPIAGLNEGMQYLRYLDPEVPGTVPDESLFRLEPKPAQRTWEHRYVCVQPGTGNNKAPWKTWPLASWKKLVRHITDTFPHLSIVLLGDDTETPLAPEFEMMAPQVHSLIGKTSLPELPSIVGAAVLHIGGDSALQHIAGCVGTPTVTIWGGSDPETFGWHKINAQKHRLVKHTIACQPCNRWIAPNTSRVKNPLLCPDFKCIRSIEEEEVFRVVSEQLVTIGHVS